MANLTLGYGVAMVLLGLGGYYGTGAKSPTALIPVAFGLLALLCGVLAKNERFRMHAMHGAAVLALLGFLGPLRVFPQMLTLAMGGVVLRPAAVVAQIIMMVLSGIFLALCVKSFIAARRGRAA
jgi:thiamine transporter ThiT